MSSVSGYNNGESQLHIRAPLSHEGSALHRLIAKAPPLDCNSEYCYHLLARHFRDTCVVAVNEDGVLAGCITAYLRPDACATLFVWQVAVAPEARGRGLALKMLEVLLQRPACCGVKFLETTVAPANIASNRTFESLADKRSAGLAKSDFLAPSHFEANQQHEAEVLLRIGPLPQKTSASAKESQEHHESF